MWSDGSFVFAKRITVACFQKHERTPDDVSNMVQYTRKSILNHRQTKTVAPL